MFRYKHEDLSLVVIEPLLMTEQYNPMQAIKIGAAILNYNGCELLLRTLSSLKASTRLPDVICVVDNASSDGSAAAVREAHPDVHVIELPRNLGGPGINAGFDWLAGQGCAVLWKLDNDIELDPWCIEHMEEAARRQPQAILSPVIYYADPPGKVWFAGGHIDWIEMRSDRHCEDVESFRKLPLRNRFISGCAMWIPVEVYSAMGGYDPRFFLYVDDTDFSVRAVCRGYSLDLVPEARLAHLISASTGGARVVSPIRLYYELRGALLFWRRHLGFRAFHRRWCQAHLGKWMCQLPFWWENEEHRAKAEAVADALWYFVSCQRDPVGRPRSPRWFQEALQKRPWIVGALIGFDFRSLLGRSR